VFEAENSTVTVKTQEYQTMDDVIELQSSIIAGLKTQIEMMESQADVMKSLLECKNALIEYYEIGDT